MRMQDFFLLIRFVPVTYWSDILHHSCSRNLRAREVFRYRLGDVHLVSLRLVPKQHPQQIVCEMPAGNHHVTNCRYVSSGMQAWVHRRGVWSVVTLYETVHHGAIHVFMRSWISGARLWPLLQDLTQTVISLLVAVTRVPTVKDRLVTTRLFSLSSAYCDPTAKQNSEGSPSDAVGVSGQSDCIGKQAPSPLSMYDDDI